MKRIVHLTSAHPRYDTRIFVKECRSLARSGYEVFLVVADGLGDEVREGVRICDVGKPSGRYGRLSATGMKLLSKARELPCDLYHFHDPELLWVGWSLKRGGSRVVYDAHEDLPRQILAKSYIPGLFRKLLSDIAERIENGIARRMDAVVVPTPHIAERFSKIQKIVVEIRNYPVMTEFPEVAWETREPSVCYVGAISRTRGIDPLIRSLPRCGATLELAGSFRPESLKREMEALPGWRQVRYHGLVDRAGVSAILSRCKAGVVTLLPTPGYVDALPVKMFEYMAAGIPVIASDFPLWRSIVEEHRCGLCVDPADPEAIAEAVRTLLSDDAAAREMGRRGSEAALEQYRWGVEERKLLELYGQVGV